MREDDGEFLGGLIGLIDSWLVRRRPREPKCATCGKRIQAGQPHEVGPDGNYRHLKCESR